MKKETHGQAPKLRWKNSQSDLLKANVGPNDSSTLDMFFKGLPCQAISVLVINGLKWHM